MHATNAIIAHQSPEPNEKMYHHITQNTEVRGSSMRLDEIPDRPFWWLKQ